MTPEQQAFLQQQHQAFVQFQQNFQTLQQNPPQLPLQEPQSQSSNSLTQPQTESQPKRGRTKWAAKIGKGSEPVSEKIPTCRGFRYVGNQTTKRYLQNVLLEFSRINEHVPGVNNEELFGADARPRPPEKQRPDKNTSNAGSSSSSQFGVTSFVSNGKQPKRRSRMPYEQLAEFKKKRGCYFQGLYYQVPSQDLERGLVRVSDGRSTSYMFDAEEAFGPHKKRYFNDFFVDEMVDWAEMEVETEGVEARTSTTDAVEDRNSTTQNVEAMTSTKDKGKEKVSEDASYVVETRRCTVKVIFETEYESDDDSDYQSDKSVDYLSPSEDELVKLRNRMKANKKANAKAKDKPDEDMNEPNKENIMPADNVRGETSEERDIYMNGLMKSLKTADKDGITEDPFISDEKQVERSGEVRVVAKCGQRPPRVFDPKKDGWKTFYRRIITLDGCFLKSHNQGKILTVIGRDGNNHIYPVAWAVVNAENKDNWTWFLELLEEDLGCIRGNGLTIMSDQHKGLIEVVKDVMPNAEHRFWHVIPAGGNLYEVISGSEGFTIDEGKRTCSCRMWQLSGLPCVHATKSTVLPPKPRKRPGRPKKKRIRAIGEGGSSTRVSKVLVGLEEVLYGSRGRGSRGGADGSRGGVSRSIGRGAGGSGGASGSRGRGIVGSRGGASESIGRGAGGSKRKHVSIAGTQKRQGKKKTQIEDQVEQTEDQAEIDLTQLEQTQEPTQDHVHPQ
nr:multidrug resistance-associated protein 5 [Tanacetum cinerariifolium]